MKQQTPKGDFIRLGLGFLRDRLREVFRQMMDDRWPIAFRPSSPYSRLPPGLASHSSPRHLSERRSTVPRLGWEIKKIDPYKNKQECLQAQTPRRPTGSGYFLNKLSKALRTSSRLEICEPPRLVSGTRLLGSKKSQKLARSFSRT